MAIVTFDGVTLDQRTALTPVDAAASEGAVRRKYAVMRVDKTDDGLKAVGETIDAIGVNVAQNNAGILNIQQVVADEKTARATAVEQLSTTVGENTASITNIAESVDGISAKEVFAVNAQGRTVAITLESGEETGAAMVLQANKFLFVDSDGQSLQPLVYDAVNDTLSVYKLLVGGVPQSFFSDAIANIGGVLFFDGGKLKAKSVTADQIAAKTVTAGNIADHAVDGLQLAPGAVLNITEASGSPGTQIFTGSDANTWKTLCSATSSTHGTDSAQSIDLTFVFNLDQISTQGSQYGPGGPKFELQLLRDGLVVWAPDPMNLSGVGRVMLSYIAKIDSGLTVGSHTYTLQGKWNPNSYSAGTVDYTVFYTGGSAYLRTLKWNGAFPTTYIGYGWSIQLTGGATEKIILRPGAPAIAPTSAPYSPMTFTDYQTFSANAGYAIAALPSLNGGSTTRFPSKSYTATATDIHKVIGSLANYRMRIMEYRNSA